MSIKLKRSLLFSVVIIICLATWTIVLQSMTESKAVSKSSKNNKHNQNVVNKYSVKTEAEINQSIQVTPIQEDLSVSNSNYGTVKDQEMNVVTNSNHKVPSRVDKTTFNSPTRFQPEVSMNLDYDQVIWLRTDPGANVVAISEEQMPSEEARQARRELEASNLQFNVLHFAAAASDNEVERLRLFLKAGMDPNAYMEMDKGYKRTALVFSVADGHLDASRFLLENGANPNILPGQHSMMMLAVGQKNYDMVNLLLAHGADPDLNYQHFKSPLMRAVQDNRLDIVQLLLDYGADPILATQYATEHPTKLGTPIAEARMLGNREMTALLEAYIQD
ncbi:ankyrin repeat domain-containing protein [Brevibacillus brevis]|uniref:ankyrin repeat domain-containing protein n=1 Tax=Brevibacillus brevis TaxID=1393 RepID=UPI00165E0B35|nr:ankyrin repeat domain-containing protein [Brevibacillus brevis]